jgi:hypothetical protein
MRRFRLLLTLAFFSVSHRLNGQAHMSSALVDICMRSSWTGSYDNMPIWISASAAVTKAICNSGFWSSASGM